MKPSLAALAFGVVLSGCAVRAPEPALLPMPPRSLAPAPASAPAPARKASPDPGFTYSYNPAGKRDPFLVDSVHHPLPPPSLGCAEPTCRYSLEELKLTGIISGMGNPVAVLESPRGKGYSVYRGSMVGKEGGVVKQILRDSVVVVQSWSDSQGRTHEEEIILRMRADAPIVLDE